MTNRRSFFRALATIGASFTILPSALTYARSWKPVGRLVVPNPAWELAEYEVYWLTCPGAYDPSIFSASDVFVRQTELPVRYRHNDETGKFELVPTHIPA